MKAPLKIMAAATLSASLAACVPNSRDDRYGYNPNPPPPPAGYYDDGYDPVRDYREDRRYDRALSRQDRVYRGRDGRYYCRRNDGTTGLVIGGLSGGALGAILGGGGLVGTLVGAAGGAILGREIDKGEVRCR